MMCHSTGFVPILTIGLGLNSVSSRRRVPKPPHRITTFILLASPGPGKTLLRNLSRNQRLRQTARNAAAASESPGEHVPSPGASRLSPESMHVDDLECTEL